MKRSENQKGFTLIELIVVIAVLGILAAIAVPSIISLLERARIAADQATVRILNSVTPLYRYNDPTSDPFDDNTKSNQELIGELASSGYLTAVVEPQSKDADFEWLFDEQHWYLMFTDSYYVITLADGFAFSNGRLSGSYAGQSKDVIIPVSINGLNVKELYQDVFRNKGMVAVSFESNNQVQRIHARAFMNNNLANIEFPETLNRIDWGAFSNNNLTEIILPNSLTRMEGAAFNGNDLSKITIGSSVEFINDGNNNALGSHTASFKQAYSVGGAGTYIYNGTSWIKQA